MKVKRPDLTLYNQKRKGKTYEELYGNENAQIMKTKLKKYCGENAHSWRGGSHDYLTKTARNIMEKKIGRKLLSIEIVHHIDRDIRNNHPDNLHLFKNRSEHIKYHLFLEQLVKVFLLTKQQTKEFDIKKYGWRNKNGKRI